jgi:translation initiation factor 2 alpha subunit (eIF-2alpha)
MSEATNKTVNYTQEMLDTLFSMYEELGNEGLDQIAETLNKPVKSIRSKLVREGKYVASPKTSVKLNGPSKKELLRELESQGFDPSGFEGATKVALSRLLNIVGN